MGIFRFRRQNLGKGFSDFLEKKEGRQEKRRQRRGEEKIHLGARLKLGGAFLLLFLGIFGLLERLFYLTVVRGGYYRDLAENNRVREETIAAPRGVIYDRQGRVLARNRPIYKIPNSKSQTISREKALELEAKGEKVVVELGREYPERAVAAHLVGYMGEVSEADLQMSNVKCQMSNDNCRKYYLGEWRGRSGAEETFEEVLRGAAGKRLVEVDSLGKEIRELGRVEAIAGENVYLALDLDLQKAAAEALAGQKGAVVVSSSQTGEILALYSSPSFEPNLFMGEDESKESNGEVLEKLLKDSERPLFNRAISGLYPPGSTFKIVTATAGLESGLIDETTTVEDVGIINLGPYRFPNWYFTQYGKKEGEVDVVKAIQRSNDIFFYKTGEWLGIEKLEEWAKRFGLGRKLGIEIAGEAEGIVRLSREWYLGDTYHLAIGQGDLLVTPLQVNFWTAVIANQGKLCRPTVLRKLEDLGDFGCQDLGLSEKTLDLIIEGMKKACEPGGTGWPLFGFKVQGLRLRGSDSRSSRFKEEGWRQIPVACKTGTAEYGDAEGKTHAWLTALAPADSPEIVVTVLVEGGGEGSSVAGPIVKKVLEEWFEEGPSR